MATSRSVRIISPFVCQSCRHRIAASSRRSFGTSNNPRAEDTPKSQDRALSGLQNLSNQIKNGPNRSSNPSSARYGPDSSPFMNIIDQDPESLLGDEFSKNLEGSRNEQPHRLHIYAHKHNTHITFVQPARSAADTAHLRLAGTKASATEQKKTVDTLLSLSTGNIGFKKAGRGSYDAAFQLTAFALKQMQEKGMMRDVNSLQVLLRGFGAGREAVTKALLGTEGRVIRQYITSVVDATRLKQGGPRAKKPRRLG